MLLFTTTKSQSSITSFNHSKKSRQGSTKHWVHPQFPHKRRCKSQFPWAWGSWTHGTMHPCHAPAPENIKAMSAAPGGDLQPQPGQPLHSRISISLPAPACTHLRMTHRRVGPGEHDVHMSVILVLRVGLHLCRSGEITRPHHHHPPHREKSFPRLSLLLAVSLSSPSPRLRLSPAARREICARTPPARRGEPRIRARHVEVMLLIFLGIFFLGPGFRCFCGCIYCGFAR
jgi:hypothetical protein